MAALLTFWFTGGAVWLAHRLARRTAQYAGMPPNLFAFLAHADERVQLHRRGGGYRLGHSDLRRHIADADPSH